MNEAHVLKSEKKSFWLRWPFLLVVIPLALFLVLLVALAIQENQASNRVQVELTQLRQAAIPVDDVSMSQWYAENTSRERTADWGEILRLVESAPGNFGDFDRLPYVGNGERPAEIGAAATWPQEPEVAQFLQWMRPVIDQVRTAAEPPTPVWQPISFQGFGTLLPQLQSSRNVVRLLNLDVEHALHHRDSDRALRGLASMRGTADAFDSQTCMVDLMVQIALRQVHHTMIRRSLTVELWDEEQLQQLSEQVGPPTDIASRWQRVIAGERAMMLASLSEPSHWQPVDVSRVAVQWMFALPSSRMRLLETYRDMESIGAGGLDGLSQRAAAWERTWAGDGSSPPSMLLTLGQMHRSLLPATADFAAVIEREEDSRRFSQTALAIKRFQLQEQRWPEALRELVQAGLPASDWNTVSAGPFGYEVAGDEAYLWSYDLQEDPRLVSPTRPEIDPEKEILDNLLTIIR